LAQSVAPAHSGTFGGNDRPRCPQFGGAIARSAPWGSRGGVGSSASPSAAYRLVNRRHIEHSRRAVRSAPDSDNTASSQRKSRGGCGVWECSRASERVASTASDPANNSAPTSSRQSVLSTQRRGSRRSCPRLSTRSPHAAIAYIIHIMRSDVAVDARFAAASISRAPFRGSASPQRRNRWRFTNAVVRPLVPHAQFTQEASHPSCSSTRCHNIVVGPWTVMRATAICRCARSTRTAHVARSAAAPRRMRPLALPIVPHRRRCRSAPVQMSISPPRQPMTLIHASRIL
jgi:ribosomal protein L37AE/L43A